MRNRKLFFLLIIFSIGFLSGKTNAKDMPEDPRYRVVWNSLKFRNIDPALTSKIFSDAFLYPGSAEEFYSVFASEGILKTPSTDELDAFLEERMSIDQIPGMLVAVVSEEKIIYLKTLGMADLENQVPVTDSTIFEIGSISKQFTATLIMQLMEKEELSLDDVIQTYVPEIPGEWYGITIRQLLNHTSGIPDYETIAGYRVYDRRTTTDKIIEIANTIPLDFEPGEKYNYSNTGYYLLSVVVERITGQPIEKVLSEKIFKPINATTMGFSDPVDIISNRSSGYARTRGRLENRPPTESSTSLGAGAMISNVYDLIKWDEALSGSQILSEESKKIMWSPGILNNGNETNYGFGWQVEPYNGYREQYHYGMTPGFVANMTRFPDQKLTFIVMANRHQMRVNRIVQKLMDTFLEEDK